MNDFLKITCFLLCLLILSGQLYRAKRTNSINTHWAYHLAAAMMAMGVSCKMLGYVWPSAGASAVQWTDLPLLLGVLIFQVCSMRRWQRDVPQEFSTGPAELRPEQ